MDCSPPSSSVHGIDFPGKNTGVCYHFLLQGIFLTLVSHPRPLHLLHWQVDSLPLSHLGGHIYRYIHTHTHTHTHTHLYIYTYTCIYIYICAYMLSHFSHVWLLVTLWTIAHQAPLSVGFSRQEYWSGLPCASPHMCVCVCVCVTMYVHGFTYICM